MSFTPILSFINTQGVCGQNKMLNLFHGLLENGWIVKNIALGRNNEQQTRDSIKYFSKQEAPNLHTKEYLFFDAALESENFLISVGIFCPFNKESNIPYIFAWNNQAGYFRFAGNPNSKSEHFSMKFLEFGKTVFKFARPEFGWIDMIDPGDSPEYEVVKKAEIPEFYWTNFFGAQYISKYGLDQFLNLPVWSTEPLLPEGALCVLSPHIGYFETDITSTIRQHFIDSIG